jgi:hypothetical protein
MRAHTDRPFGQPRSMTVATTLSWSGRARGRRWLLALVAAAAVLRAAPARACGPCQREPRLYGRTVKPASGLSGVPLNTSIWVRYETARFAGSVGGNLVLRPLDGTPVEVERQTIPSVHPFDRCHEAKVVVLRPRAPLRSDTTYEVLDQLPDVCPDASCQSVAPELISRFVTGQAEDHEPPSFMGIRRWAKGEIDECDDSACCGPYRAARFSVEADPGSDAVGLVGYEVTVDGTVSDLVTSPALQGWVFCGGGVIPVKGPSGAPRPVGRYRFNAVDLAGNRDPNTVEVPVMPVCSPAGRDRDAAAAVDDPVDPGVLSPKPGRGCAFARVDPAGVPALWLLVLLAAPVGGRVLRSPRFAPGNGPPQELPDVAVRD